MNDGQREWARFQLRLPPELHARLAERAAQSNRSLNAEIVVMLQLLGAPAAPSAGEAAIRSIVRDELVRCNVMAAR